MSLPEIALALDEKAKDDPLLKGKLQELCSTISPTERHALLDANALNSASGKVDPQAAQWVYRTLKGWSKATLGAKYVALKTMLEIKKVA